MKPQAFSHIIWDWNGTLFDDSRLCVEIINEMLLSRGKAVIDSRRYEECFDFPIRRYYERVGFDFSEESFADAATEFVSKYDLRRTECRLQGGAEEALRNLKEEGLGQSILSATEQSILNQMVDAFPIRPLFTKISGLDNHYAAGKLENGKRLLEDLACAPDRVLIIGDTDHDYEVACAIGAPCILIPSGHQSRQKLERCKGAEVLSSPDEVIDYLKRTPK